MILLSLQGGGDSIVSRYCFRTRHSNEWALRVVVYSDYAIEEGWQSLRKHTGSDDSTNVLLPDAPSFLLLSRRKDRKFTPWAKKNWGLLPVKFEDLFAWVRVARLRTKGKGKVEAKWLGCVLGLLIYRVRKQDEQGQESGYKVREAVKEQGTGSGRAEYRKWEFWLPCCPFPGNKQIITDCKNTRCEVLVVNLSDSPHHIYNAFRIIFKDIRLDERERSPSNRKRLLMK